MSFPSIPIIDISALRHNEPQNPKDTNALMNVASAIGEALEEFGFFYVRNHGVPDKLQEKMHDISQRFFAESPEFKMQIAMENGGSAWRGYFPPGGELTSGRPDRKEGIYFGRELSLTHSSVRAGLPLHGPNQWPKDEAYSEFKSIVTDYMSHLATLGHTLMEGIALSLELPRHYFRARFSEDPTILFRIFNYQKHVWQDHEDEWGVREHTDYGFLTILKQDNSGGLQVRSREGNWIEAPPLDDTFVINIGDMLEVWTHGLYKATPHRVQNRGQSDRLSFPFFFDPGWSMKLEPIDRPLLPKQRLARAEAERTDRWDALNLRQLTSGLTYGEFLWGKVSKVFPELASDVTNRFGRQTSKGR